MDIAAHNTSPDLDSLMTDIARYDVTQNALELQMYGFTVVPPEKLGVDEAWTSRLRDAVIRTYEKRYDVEIGDYTVSDLEPVNFGKTWRLIEEDDIFVEATLNPVGLTLIRSLLGQSAVLGNDTWLMRARDNKPRGMHTDATGVPLGAGQIAHVVNASWLCTDYLEEGDGPTVLVPGSFRFGRSTLPHEYNVDECPYPLVSLTGKAGSLAIWHGGTFHGSRTRTKAGLRITYGGVWYRTYMKPMGTWEDVSPELVERYPELDRVLGLHSPFPFREDIERSEHLRSFSLTGSDPFA